MELIIVGDDSKVVENFTRAMFEITLQRIKEGRLTVGDGKLINEEEKQK